MVSLWEKAEVSTTPASIEFRRNDLDRLAISSPAIFQCVGSHDERREAADSCHCASSQAISCSVHGLCGGDVGRNGCVEAGEQQEWKLKFISPPSLIGISPSGNNNVPLFSAACGRMWREDSAPRTEFLRCVQLRPGVFFPSEPSPSFSG
jgi:hypothetical protein